METRSSDRWHAALKTASSAAAALVIAFGAIGIAGWLLDRPSLQSLRPEWPAMRPNTALGLVLGGVSLLLLAPTGARGTRRAVGLVAAALVLTLGTVTTAQWGLGRDLGIDGVLAFVHPIRAAGPLPGRPSPPTGVAFILIGAALLALASPRRWAARLSSGLALASLLIAYVVLVGYAYGADVLFRLTRTPNVGVALPTAVAFLALALSLLAARPARGLVAEITADAAGGQLARRLLAAAILGPPVLGLFALRGLHARWLFDEDAAFAILAGMSGAIAVALILTTAASLNRADRERRRKDEALRRSEERSRSLFELAPDGIFISDLEGRFTDANGAACRILGATREEIVGKTIADLLPPEDLPRFASHRAALLGGAVEVGEWSLQRKDGTWVPVEVSAKILSDGRWQGFVRDITARKEIERELARAHDAERRLRAQLEALGRATAAISDAVAELPDKEVRAVLQTIVLQAQALTGARYAALGIGDDPSRPFDPWVFSGITEATAAAIGHAPRPVGLLGRVARSGQAMRLRDVSEHAEHAGFPREHPRMTSFLGVPIRFRGSAVGNLYLADKRTAAEFSEDDQRMVEMLAARAGTALETARLYTHEALAKAWLQGVIDGMPECVLLADADGLVSFNVAALRMAGRRAARAEGPSAPIELELVGSGGAPLAWEETPLSRALREGEAITGVELSVRDSAGHLVPMLASASPLRDRAMRTVGAVSVLQDITTLKQLERLREEWTVVIAHDLRQPLGVLKLSAQMLALAQTKRAPEERDAKAIGRILTATERLDRMVTDLLDASRIEAHQLVLQRIDIDPARLVRDIVDRIGDSLAGRRVRVHVEGAVRGVSADPARIEQVMGNLVSNAVKYGDPAAPIDVTVSCSDVEATISVSNRGPGITPEQRQRLFTRFYRARPASAEGVGLGLYITKGIVEAHGGRIWVESVPYQSTTFAFTLPRSSALGAPAPGEQRGAA